MEYFTSLAFILGIGTCSSGVDYCPDTVGKAALELTLAEQNKHSIMFEAVHYSSTSDGILGKGDRGTEFFLIEYKYRIF